MPPNKKKLVCIICLKRFLPPNEADKNINESIPVVKISSSLDSECEHLNSSSENESIQRSAVVVGSATNDDPYTRFLLFVKRYFKLTTFADRLLTCAKEAKNENGEHTKLQTFCESCSVLVNDICKLYKELQTAQLFLLWKLSLVGELMKKSSGHATDDKTYKSWGVRTSMAKQMNVVAVKPVDLFRKALQLKCVNAARNGRTMPVVSLYKGLSPDQWKFNYAAVKEILIRLFVVFTLASTELSESNHKLEATANAVDEKIVKVQNFGKRSKGRSRKRISPSKRSKTELNAIDTKSLPVKLETENVQRVVVMDEVNLLGGSHHDDVPPPGIENSGNDSDWSRGAPSPMSVRSDISDNHVDTKLKPQPLLLISPLTAKKPRKRRKIIVKAEEDGNDDDYLEKIKAAAALVSGKRENTSHEDDTQTEQILPKHYKAKKEATLKCPHCPGLFVRPRGLGQHLRTYHNKNLHYSCKNCEMRFEKHMEFIRHHRKMHPRVPVELGSGTTQGLRIRRRRRFRNGKGKIVSKYENGPYVPRPPLDPGACTQCSKVFSTRNEMLKHKSRVHVIRHSKEETYWRVLEIDKRYDPLSPSPQPEEKEVDIFAKGKSGRPKRNYLNEKELLLSEKYRKLDCEVESCGITFETAYLLRKHLETVHEDGIEESEKKVHCLYCNRKFVHKQSYEMHVRTLHQTKIFGTFLCDLDNCERIVPFLTVEALNEHLADHLDEKSSRLEDMMISYCEKCNWGFMRPEVRELHQLVHIPVEKDGRIPCSKCGERCLDMRTLQDHFIEKHDLKGVEAHQCDECEKRYFTKNTFARHKLWHKRKKDVGPSNGLQCVICEVRFKSKKSLDVHLKEHNPGYFVVCEEPGCGKKFESSRKLQIHYTTTHREREWVCEQCGEKYPTKTILMGHLKTHEAAKWPCDECGMMFKRKDKVKAHKLSVHNPNRVHAFVCSECGKGYHNPYGLRYHFDSTHKPESEWELKCPRCPRRFYRKLFLDLHLKKCEGLGGGDDDKNDGMVNGGSNLKGTSENSRKRKIKPKSVKESDGDEEEEYKSRTNDDEEIEEKPETSGNVIQSVEFVRTNFPQSSEMPLLEHHQQSDPVGNMHLYQSFIPFLEQHQRSHFEDG